MSSFVPASTIQRINGLTVANLTKLEFNRGKGVTVYPVDPLDVHAIFDLLSAEELEDVVGLYLQRERGWLMIPSTRSRRDDTMFYEFALIEMCDGEVNRQYVQVKSGSVVINLEHYRSFPGSVVVFSPAGYRGTCPENVEALDRELLERFCLEHRKLLPPAVAAWLEERPAVPHVFR